MHNIKIYIIAGEASGDILGAKLMDALRNLSTDYIDFYGIGGDRMIGHGLASLFPMADISLMGFSEVVPHIPRVLKRIEHTVEHIQKVRPDVVITIDSPGFCCRVAEKLQGKGLKLVHYVAPTVWAYKPKRAEKFARLFSHLMLLLPFEKPYFDKVGLENTYVGHPIIEDSKINGDAKKFREKYKVKVTEEILCVMPGSRVTEINRLMPIFCKAIDKITAERPTIRPVIMTIPFLKKHIKQYSGKLPQNTIIIDTPIEKADVFAASRVALAKSGTGTLELSLAGVPAVIAYKISTISYWLIKSLVKVKFANLLNLVADKEIIPEFIQNKCTPALLSHGIIKLLKDESASAQQVREAKEVLTKLGMDNDMPPSARAAKVVLDIVAQVRAGKRPYQL